MTKLYTTPEEFVADESFIRYCFHQNETDVQFWESWISEHPDQQKNVEQAIHLIESLAIKTTRNRKVKEWEKIKKQIEVQADKAPAGTNARNKLRRIWQVAAAVVLLLVITGVAIRLLNNKTAARIVYRTGPGESKQIILPDQTKVWLNADSKLIFYENFKQSDNRVVTLTGEAFFNVEKDADHPFLVQANELNIDVLGTCFNVRAYPRSATTSTTLISGAIRVSLAHQPEKTFRLQPKEKFTVANNKYKQVEYENTTSKTNKKLPKISSLKPVFQVSQVTKDPLLKNDQILETAWLDGKLAFRDKNFVELALQLAHKYGVQFHFKEERLKKYRFTGIFTKETLPEVLHALRLTSPLNPFTYRIEGDSVFIMK